MAVRYLAWLCLFLTLWPAFGVAATAPAPSAVPVVTNISGAVSVRGNDGVSRDVLSSRIIHSGDTLMTGVDSLAVVSLADIGSVRLGPTSTASASATATRLSVNISTGSACAQALSRGVSIQAGALALAAGDQSAIFSLVRGSNATTVAVYQGQMSATLIGQNAGKKPIVLKAGEAAVSSHDGIPVQVPIQTVQQDFASLKCPDQAIIARVVPGAEASPPSGGGHGGGAGGVLGILLGLGALAALAGGHGGGGGGGSPTAPPTGPGQLAVSVSSLSFLVAGSPQSFTASESSYTGPINAASGNTLVATVAPLSGSGPGPVTFTVTPTGPGSTSITVTDNHGGSRSVSVTVTPPGTLSVVPSSLSFLANGAPQQFTATELSYAGPITATSEKPMIATVSGSGSGPGPVIFTVTPKKAGNTAIDVSDDHGGLQKVSITVTPPGSLTVSQPVLAFLSSGTPQTFTASESSYAGPINAASSDASVATIAPASGTGPGPVTFTVTPTGAGTTNIVVSDDHGGSAAVAVTVAGPLTANPKTLTFVGTSTPQNFTATDAFYTGNLSAASDRPNVATVAPVGSSMGPGPVTFKVTPVSAGNATITVSDTIGGSTTVSVSVSTGALTINPTAMTFTVGGPTQTFTGSEANYTGPILANSSNTNKATVSPPSGTGPGPVSFTVTAVSAGNPTIAVTDNHGGGPLFVDLTITGPLTPTPGSLTFDGTTASQAVTVADPNYFGSITASSSDVSVATVTSPGVGPSATFSVTPVSLGSATITFSDANLGSTTVGVTVHSGPLTVSTSSVSLIGAGSTQTFTASETDYKGPINASSADTAVATVIPASAGGPTPAPFTITAVGPGTTNVNVTDNHGGLQPIAVTVVENPSVSPASLTFTDVGAGNAQSVTVSEQGYSGSFSITGNTCSGLASVGPVSGSGPSASVPVAALNTSASGGTCQFKVKDDVNGGVSSAVQVTVGPFGPVAVSQSSLTFSDVGAGNAQTFTVSESDYTGAFTIDASACMGIATVSPTSGDTDFTVTPIAGGGPCSLNITDDHSSPAATLSVTVGPFGPVVPSPTSLALTVGGGSGSFMVAESGYTGNFTLDASSCTNRSIATESPGSGNSTTTFVATPESTVGNCKIVVSDDHGGSQNVIVSVTAGALSVSPVTMQFTDTSSDPQTFSASDPGATAFGATTSDGKIATVSPTSQFGPGLVTFTVSPNKNTGQASITVTDNNGGTAVVSVGVGASPLVKKRHPISLHKPLPRAANPPSRVPRPVRLPIGPVSPLRPVVQGGNPAVTAPLRISATNLTLTEGAPGQAVGVSEPGYPRLFAASTSNAAVATISAPTAAGPVTTFTIMPRAPGVATVRIADDHGGVGMISIVVRARQSAPPRLTGRPGPQ